MPKLVSYAQVGGSPLTKAMCTKCGKKYGSIDEARLCEMAHDYYISMGELLKNIERVGGIQNDVRQRR